jgi:hypothetical protein
MAKFVASTVAEAWMANNPVSKSAEVAALVYLQKHLAPDDTILQLHHLPNHRESFNARRVWLIDEMKKAPADIWEEFAVNKIVGARLIYMAQEHARRGLRDDDGVEWYKLISAAQKMYPH